MKKSEMNKNKVTVAKLKPETCNANETGCKACSGNSRLKQRTQQQKELGYAATLHNSEATIVEACVFRTSVSNTIQQYTNFEMK